MARAITINVCDGDGCLTPITDCVVACHCTRCDREGDHVTERFHSCPKHIREVEAKHLRIYERQAVWQPFAEYARGLVTPPEKEKR